MLCSNCNKRKARIHLTDIKDGEKRELDLCEVCAKELGIGDFVVPDFAGATQAPVPDKTCPHCGRSYKDFVEKGRLGCQHDYDEFKDELTPTLKRVHQAERHRGKAPARLEASNRKQRILDYLEEELSRAVKREEYEKAAELRDRIASIEAGEAENPGTDDRTVEDQRDAPT